MRDIGWLEWSPQAFERARRERKPVLLHLSSRDSLSASLLEKALADEGVIEAVNAGYVAVRADGDKRPDLAARLGAWEGNLSILSLEGGLLNHIAFSDAARLAGALKDRSALDPSVPETAAAAPVWTGAVGNAKPDPAVEAAWPAAVADQVAGAAKSSYPCIDCLELLLYAASEWKHGRAREVVGARLAELAQGACFDKKSGAFAAPGARATTEVNARWSRLFWDANACLGVESLGETAARVSDFLLRELYDPSAGAFRAAAGDDDKVYFAEGNALAALTMLKAGAVTGEARFADASARLLLFLQQLCDPERGMSRYWEGGSRGPVYGLLADAASTMAAFTESFLVSGIKTHREFADTLLRGLFQENWERERGGFCDRAAQPDDFGELRRPLIPPALNAAAFEAAWRLHEVKGNPQYKTWIVWGLKRLAADVGSQPCPAAPLARVADIVARGRLDLELVGRPSEAKTQALLAAVNLHYLPRKIISFVDPDDQDYIMAHKLKPGSLPRLYGCIDLRPKTEAGSPQEVPGFLKELTS